MSAAPSSGNLLKQKYLHQFIQKATVHGLYFQLGFRPLADLPAQMVKHIFIRILIIQTAAFIISIPGGIFKPLLLERLQRSDAICRSLRNRLDRVDFEKKLQGCPFLIRQRLFRLPAI